jgi:hypothetical protein
MSATQTPWMTWPAASDHLSGGATTESPDGKRRRKFSKQFLAKQVAAGKLKAAKVGGRGELLFRREWLDEWLESLAAPVMVSARRRA